MTTAWRIMILLALLAWTGSCLFAGRIVWGQQATPAQIPSERQSPAPSPTNNILSAVKWKRFDYTCEGGTKITLYLHNNTAKVRTKGHLYLIGQTTSADGNRYSDGKVLWWGKGDAGFLQEEAPDGDGKMLVTGCVLDKPADVPKP